MDFELSRSQKEIKKAAKDFVKGELKNPAASCEECARCCSSICYLFDELSVLLLPLVLAT